jgi:hypothetical protein
MRDFGIVEGRLVPANYDTGGGRSNINYLSVHYIQFGPHREHNVLRLERSADRSIGNDCL